MLTIVWGTILIVFLVMLAPGPCSTPSTSYARVDDDVVDAENDTHELASQISPICWFCAALFFCAVCCMRRQIMLAMGVVKEAAKVVNSMMLIVMLLIVQGIGITIFLVVFIYIVYIATAGENNFNEKDSKGSFYNRGKNSFGMELPDKLPYHTFEVTENQESALWFMLFDLFWTMEFVEALGQIIVATAAATYYFTRDRSTIGNSTVVFAARHATWYHAGMAALAVSSSPSSRLLKRSSCTSSASARTPSTRRATGRSAHAEEDCQGRLLLLPVLHLVPREVHEVHQQGGLHPDGHLRAPLLHGRAQGLLLGLANLKKVAALETIGGAIFFITKLMIAATCALVCYIWLGQAFTEETHSIAYSYYWSGSSPATWATFVDVVDMVADTLLICFIADERSTAATGGQGSMPAASTSTRTRSDAANLHGRDVLGPAGRSFLPPRAPPLLFYPRRVVPAACSAAPPVPADVAPLPRAAVGR